MARREGDAPHLPRSPAQVSAPSRTIRGKRAPVSPRRAKHSPSSSHWQEVVVNTLLQPGRGRETAHLQPSRLPPQWAGRRQRAGERGEGGETGNAAKAQDLPRQRGASTTPVALASVPAAPASKLNKGPARTRRSSPRHPRSRVLPQNV